MKEPVSYIAMAASQEKFRRGLNFRRTDSHTYVHTRTYYLRILIASYQLLPYVYYTILVLTELHKTHGI